MDDEVLRAFYKFAHERSKHTTWANHFIIALVDEVVRLRVAYEGFTYHASEPAVKADALTPCPNCGEGFAYLAVGDMCSQCSYTRTA